MTPTRNFWHAGKRIGLTCAIIAFGYLACMNTLDPAGRFAWLKHGWGVVAVLPLLSATLAYHAGQKDAASPVEEHGNTKSLHTT